MFYKYSGTIDKQELNEILKETMGKKMSPILIKRYIDAQFQLYDKGNIYIYIL